MNNMFKRFVLWNCRVMQHIPGFKRYGRFMERHYTKHFWRTYLTVFVTSIALNHAILWLCNWYLKRLKAKNNPDLSWLEERAKQGEGDR